MIYTTLELCKKAGACSSVYKKLVKQVGLNYPKNEPISLLAVLESNDLSDALWVLQYASIGDNRTFSMGFGVWCAEQCSRCVDTRVDNAAMRCAASSATAAWTAARAGNTTAAAKAAIWTAAYEADAWATDDPAASDTAMRAASDAQEKQLIKMLNEQKEAQS